MIAAPDLAFHERRQWGLHLGGALADKQFELFYQPVIRLHDQATAGFEALLRWRHPSFGLVSPQRFVPAIEDIGLIVPAGDWVVRRACEEAALWPAGFKLAVNLSAAQLAAPNLVSAVATILNETGLPPALLELEVAESALGADALNRTFAALRALGVRLTLDDLSATPAAPAAAAARAGISRVKLGRDLMASLSAPATARTAADLLGAYVAQGIAISAKRVETAQQRDTLAACGCQEAQGFLFGPPRPAWALPNVLDTGPGDHGFLLAGD